MIHLTLSEAGRPFCGCPHNSTDSFFQAVYAPVAELREDICPACLSIWNESDVRFYLETIQSGYHVWVTVNGLTVSTATFDDADHKHPRQAAKVWLKSQGAKG